MFFLKDGNNIRTMSFYAIDIVYVIDGLLERGISRKQDLIIMDREGRTQTVDNFYMRWIGGKNQKWES